MILLTQSQRARLLANGRTPDADHIPVVKFFNPFGQGTWLATELDEESDILFGLADLGYLELGSWSLSEMAAIRLPFGLGIERDLHFEGRFPIPVRAEVARAEGSISAAERVLLARAQREGGASFGRTGSGGCP